MHVSEWRRAVTNSVGGCWSVGTHGLVVGVTYNELAENRKLIRLHSTATRVVYKTVNPYASVKCPLFFMSDPPHLSEMLGRKVTYGLVLQLLSTS